jgi:hypothetical protein
MEPNHRSSGNDSVKSVTLRTTLPRVRALRWLIAAALLTVWPGAGSAAAYDAAPSADSSLAPANGRLIEVPADVPTLEAAIAAAQPGDVILLAAGTYRGGVTIPKEKHDLTIREADRNLVILDGKDVLLSAIEIKADRVSLENLTARHYTGNGFEWDAVDGFSGRYLTVWNVGLYGIYAIESRQGMFEHDLVSAPEDTESMADPVPAGLRPFADAPPARDVPPAMAASPAVLQALALLAAGIVLAIVAGGAVLLAGRRRGYRSGAL